MSEALDAVGSLLQIGDGASPESWTSVAEVNVINFAVSLDTQEVTHHESPGAFKERVATLLDIGPVTLDVNFIPTEATHRDASGGLLDDMLAKTLRNFKFVFPDAGLTQYVFSAFVTNLSIAAPIEGKLGGSVTLTSSGQPTLA
jgi:predicted secreted protein